MKLHLKKIIIYYGACKQSNSFDADVYFGGKKIGVAFNPGNGNTTSVIYNYDRYSLYNHVRELYENMPPEEYEHKGVKYSFRMTLERAIDNLIKDHIQAEYKKKNRTKLERDIERGLCYKHLESDTSYQIMTWGKDGKWPIEKILKNKILRNALLDKLTELRVQKKIILNTNLNKY
jgi:hypothetical protein